MAKARKWDSMTKWMKDQVSRLLGKALQWEFEDCNKWGPNYHYDLKTVYTKNEHYKAKKFLPEPRTRCEATNLFPGLPC